MLGNNQFEKINNKILKERIESNSNLKFIDCDYKNQNSKIKLQCECGEIFESTYRKLRENNYDTKCKKCRTKERKEKIINNTKEDFIQYINNTGEYQIISYNGSHNNCKLRCLHCGKEFEIRPDSFKSGSRCKCNSLSRGERKITQFLKENKFNFEHEYSFNDLVGINGGRLRFDFAIFENNELKYLIEYNGIQHYNIDNYLNHSSGFYDYRMEHDQMKIDYCKKNNIKLIIIKYDEYDEIYNILYNSMAIRSQVSESQEK